MEKKTIREWKDQGGLGSTRDSSPDDVLLVCASYEPRTMAVANLLSPAYRARNAIIYVNTEFLSSTTVNFSHLKETLDEHCEQVIVAEGSWLDPKTQLGALKKAAAALAGLSEQPTITLDTTTFNREALLTSVAMLRAQFGSAEIRVLYVSPQDHGEWLSRGYRCIRNVMGFAGIQRSSRRTLLIVLSGFEPERTSKIIEEHEPSRVLIGIGDPPTDKKFLERNQAEQELILARQDVAEFRFPANNVADCRDCLEGIIAPYLSDYNVVIAPMSTKLSSLASFLIVEGHPEIQLTYCVPGEYNVKDYSKGADSLFVDFIPPLDR